MSASSAAQSAGANVPSRTLDVQKSAKARLEMSWNCIAFPLARTKYPASTEEHECSDFFYGKQTEQPEPVVEMPLPAILAR
jgi:hypothetical protein